MSLRGHFGSRLAPTRILVLPVEQPLLLIAFMSVVLPVSSLIQQYQFVPIAGQKFQSSTSALIAALTTNSKLFCSTKCAATPSCSILAYSSLWRRCELYDFNLARVQYGFVADADWVTMLRAIETDQSISLLSTYRSTPGLRISSGHIESAENFTCSGVMSAQTCRAICETITGNCSVFSYNSQTGSCIVSFLDFYDDWTQLDGSQSGWTGYYKIIANKQKLLFKINSGIGVDLSGTFLTAGLATPFATRLQMAPNATCGGCWLKSDVLENWSLFGISQISIHFFAAGVDDAYVHINTVGASASTFFTQSRLIGSRWTDLAITTADVTFGMGNGTINQGRNFYSQIVKKCGDDQCWFAVQTVNATICTEYLGVGAFPHLGYIDRATKDGCKNMRWADTLMVYGTL